MLHIRRAFTVATLAVGCALGIGTHSSLAATTLEQMQSDRQQQLHRALEHGTLDGHFVERPRGSYVFVPDRVDLPEFQVANPEAIGTLAVGPLLKVRGQVQEDRTVSVSSYALDTASSAQLRFAQVQLATRRLRTALDEAVKPGAMNVATRSFQGPTRIETDTRQGIADIVVTYSTLVRNNAAAGEIEELAREWSRLRGQLVRTYSESDESKAIYGDPDNYAPWRYDRIFRQSPAVVAIGAPGASRPRCSAVLIASDLVLTAGHCFAVPFSSPPNELEAWFGYVSGPDDSEPDAVERIPIAGLAAPRPERLPDILSGSFSPNLLDYVVVRLTRPRKDASGNPAAPECLRRTPLHKGEPVYVMGFPEGRPMTVHDSARVYLPYRILDGSEFYKLRLDIHADLLAIASYQEAERRQFMEQFDTSYVAQTLEGLPWRFLRHVEDGGEPRMGIVSDTFRGNSGGPVYERERRQCVVGILVAGSPDTGFRRTANWKEHERVLPVGAVLQDIEKDERTRDLIDMIRVE